MKDMPRTLFGEALDRIVEMGWRKVKHPLKPGIKPSYPKCVKWNFCQRINGKRTFFQLKLSPLKRLAP